MRTAVTALTGEYQLEHPGEMPPACAAETIRVLEEAGVLPYRSVASSSLQIGGYRMRVDGVECDVLIINRLVGLVPLERVGERGEPARMVVVSASQSSQSPSAGR